MVFSSTTFLFLFLPIVLILYYNPIFKSLKFKNIILILSSIFFYAWGEPVFVLLMLASIILNWFFGLLVDKYQSGGKAKAVIAASVFFNMGMLFVFKYLTFTLQNLNLLLGTHLNTLGIELPIGISFFTFQAMSYVIDVYRKNGNVQKNPLNVALYISFFPQLIAGPIVRYKTIAEQINERHVTADDFANGVYRFMIGFCKKVLIANNVALVADEIFGNAENSVASAWIGAIAYTLQILFDFSGYSEMAIGLGKMFGFTFLENFDYPYISKSVSEFWRRWHISLGTWFRDYVYFPLGGSRVKKSRLVFNLFVVWSLTGIWHGANWTFIMWGLLYFVILTIEKLTGFTPKLKAFGHIYTMFFVIIGWVLFRADSIGAAFDYLKTMFGIGTVNLTDSTVLFYLSNYKFYFAAGILCCFPIVPFIKKKIDTTKPVIRIIAGVLLLLSFLLSLTFIIKGSYNPFIYFNF
ncbi:MAG: MBOAT family protein [Clostridia bacterium]|nr:MBOAT family protein [Clostridia bacterium]